LGGGVILTLIHDIDYLVWLFGAPRRLFAVGGHLTTLQLDVEDVASLLMDCAGGTGPLPVHLQMDYVRRPPRRTCAVLGDDGWAELDLQLNRLVIASATGEIREMLELPALERNELFIEELRHFLAARIDRTTPAVGLRDGIIALRVALAAHESLLTERSVDIQ
jgi:predicted dehydrogenase